VWQDRVNSADMEITPFKNKSLSDEVQSFVREHYVVPLSIFHMAKLNIQSSGYAAL